MKKLDQKGALDGMLVIALLLVVAFGAFAFTRINSADQTVSNNEQKTETSTASNIAQESGVNVESATPIETIDAYEVSLDEIVDLAEHPRIVIPTSNASIELLADRSWESHDSLDQNGNETFSLIHSDPISLTSEESKSFSYYYRENGGGHGGNLTGITIGLADEFFDYINDSVNADETLRTSFTETTLAGETTVYLSERKKAIEEDFSEEYQFPEKRIGSLVAQVPIESGYVVIWYTEDVSDIPVGEFIDQYMSNESIVEVIEMVRSVRQEAS